MVPFAFEVDLLDESSLDREERAKNCIELWAKQNFFVIFPGAASTVFHRMPHITS